MKKIMMLIGVFKVLKRFNSKEDTLLCIGDIIKEIMIFTGCDSDNKNHYKWFVKDRTLKSESTNNNFQFIQEDYGEIFRFLTYSRNLQIGSTSKTQSKKVSR